MHLRHPVTAIATFIIALVLISEPVAIPQTHAPAANPTTKLEGRYSVSGTNPDGGEYTGSLDVIARGGVYQFRWNAGTQYDGVGVRNGRIVAVAFANGSDGSGCGVVDYTVLKDGTLEGIWGYWGNSGSGTERARHVSGRGFEGEYAATGTNPDGKLYQVNISVQAAKLRNFSQPSGPMSSVEWVRILSGGKPTFPTCEFPFLEWLFRSCVI